MPIAIGSKSKATKPAFVYSEVPIPSLWLSSAARSMALNTSGVKFSTVSAAPPWPGVTFLDACQDTILSNFPISDDVALFLAQEYDTNIRELEGALNKLIAFSSLEKKEITIELAEEALKDLISPNTVRQITPELIMDIVAEHYNISISDLRTRIHSSEREELILLLDKILKVITK